MNDVCVVSKHLGSHMVHNRFNSKCNKSNKYIERWTIPRISCPTFKLFISQWLLYRFQSSFHVLRFIPIAIANVCGHRKSQITGNFGKLYVPPHWYSHFSIHWIILFKKLLLCSFTERAFKFEVYGSEFFCRCSNRWYFNKRKFWKIKCQRSTTFAWKTVIKKL